jgi:recombination protein RecA
MGKVKVNKIIEIDDTKKGKKKSTKKRTVKPQVTKAQMNQLVASINKKFGDNAISLGFPEYIKGGVERIPTGSFALDIALGGGLPLGRFTEISGALSSTKTAQCLHIVRNAQENGLVCAYIDLEGTTDRNFIEKFGIDFDLLLYSRPDSMEEATQMLLDLQKSKKCNLAVLDSIAALSPNREQGSRMDETVQLGITPQLLGEYFRKYQANNNWLEREGEKPFTLVGINQLREKIGAYGDPEYAPGGRSKGFTCSVSLRLRKGDWITEGSGEDREIVGQVVKFKIDKNKTFKRMTTGEFDFYFAENNAGVDLFYNDTFKEIIILAIEWGVVERTGAWFKYEDEKYQGINSLVEALKKDEETVSDLKDKILYLATQKTD